MSLRMRLITEREGMKESKEIQEEKNERKREENIFADV